MKYFNWVIKNTNNGQFMVCYRECGTDSVRKVYKTFDEAYKAAKAYNFGDEPINEVVNH